MGRLVVVARLQLIAQAVTAALRGHGLPAEPLSLHEAAHRPGRRLEPCDVVVLLDDLASQPDIEATCALVAGTPARCLVLTRQPAGPAWGAVLAAGAAAVLAPDGSLEGVLSVLSRVADRESLIDEDRRTELMSAWAEWQAEDERLRARVARLSPREEQILVLLSRGSTVVDITDTLGVAETTVRSQIKSMRRKLGVDSQLGAVAVLHRLGGPGAAIPHPRRRVD